MNARKKSISFKKLQHLIIILAFAGILIYGITTITYANINPSSPDVIVTIDANGNSTQEGSLFGDDFWYPGYEKSGTIRISSTGGASINRLGLDMSLNSFKPEYTEQTVYDSFMNNMRLTVKKGHLLVFSDTLIDDMSLAQVDASGGIELSGLDRLLISAGGFVDLEYTLRMDMNAGKELQLASANLTFQIDMNENPAPTAKPTSPPTTEPTVKPSPLPDYNGHWAHDCIETLIKHEILEPYEDGTIRPENYITRTETAVLLGKALKLEDMKDAPNPYKDEISDWGRGYIISTFKAGVFKGYPGPYFRGGQEIPREQMAAVLVRAFNLSLLANHDLNFADADKISFWAEEEVKKAVENNVIVGYPDGTFRPKDRITRAETFTIVCKLLKFHPEH